MLRVTVLALTLVLTTTALPAVAEPTPGLNLSLTRIVPEPWETNDYISLDEGRAYLDELNAAFPDLMEIKELGPSYGWDNIAGGHDTFQVFVVEVTNEKSTLTRDQKKVLIFQLSIHGNEKGGREGGLRAIEDLVTPLGWGAAYREALDQFLVVFTFPNVDGWTHEEAAYRHTCPGYVSVGPPDRCVETQGFVRVNGRGRDMNRDWPTVGWYNDGGNREHALSEPEMVAMEAYLRPFKGRTVAASDIHGMLSPADGGLDHGLDLPGPLGLLSLDGHGARSLCAPDNPVGFECAIREGHFVLGMMVAAQSDPKLNLLNVRFAERTKTMLNTMAEEKYPYWAALPNVGYLGGQWMEWGTVWDTLGYTDSGFTGDYLAQFLGAPGISFELSYNHMGLDNHYIPELNAMHVESTRTIIQAFLDEALSQAVPDLATEGVIAWLGDDRVVTSADGPAQDGAHLNSSSDDHYERGYEARPDRFWEDLASWMPPGSLRRVTADDLAAGRFHDARALVIAGDRWDLVKDDAQALEHLRMHLAQGKRLVLTDSALRGLEALGLAEAGAVEEAKAYIGNVDLDLEHPLAKDIRGLAHQTYDSVLLGYPLPTFGSPETHAPVWTVASSGMASGAEAAGTTSAPDRVSVGRIPSGTGDVVFLGALLPTPSEDAYIPYGLADHGVTYTGYQLLYNALGIAAGEREGADLDPAATPEAPPRAVPGPGALLPALALTGAALALARRRSA